MPQRVIIAFSTTQCGNKGLLLFSNNNQPQECCCFWHELSRWTTRPPSPLPTHIFYVPCDMKANEYQNDDRRSHLILCQVAIILLNCQRRVLSCPARPGSWLKKDEEEH